MSPHTVALRVLSWQFVASSSSKEHIGLHVNHTLFLDDCDHIWIFLKAPPHIRLLGNLQGSWADTCSWMDMTVLIV
jgi:hypothetical protein